MRRIGCVLVSVLAAGAACAKESGDTHARFPASATSGALHSDEAVFELACTPGAPAQMKVVLFHPDQFKTFPFGRYEGPDGIGNEHAYAHWSVEGPGKQPATLDTLIGGWYGVDGDGWVFATGGEAAQDAALARWLVKLADPGARRVRLTVKSPEKDAPRLDAIADLSHWHAEIARVAQPCLPAAH